MLLNCIPNFMSKVYMVFDFFYKFHVPSHNAENKVNNHLSLGVNRHIGDLGSLVFLQAAGTLNAVMRNELQNILRTQGQAFTIRKNLYNSPVNCLSE